MLAENIKTLRKQKGFSQEEVAARLNVVRQTVSKWEKGLSIPDTETTMRLAELFGVSVSELIGEEIKEDHSADVAEQLSRLNALTAIEIQNKLKLRKTIITIVIIVIAAGILIALLPHWNSMWHDLGKNLFHALND